MITKVKQIFDNSSKELKRLSKLVEEINRLETVYEQLSNGQLQAKTSFFKEELKNGKTLDDIKADAFASIREAARRVLGLRHYDVQLIGGLVLHNGCIAQMNTGEGKTLVATLASYLHALSGKGVHVITANEYLARRDKELMGQVHEFMGLTVGLNISQMDPAEKKEAYKADITYGTGTEFGFDYLRDNMVTSITDKVQRELHFAIVDEIDSILIDEARTPLIIANKTSEGADLFNISALIIKSFKEAEDYEMVSELKQVFLTEKGASKIEAAFGIENLYDADHQALLHNIMQSLRASVLMKLDVDYIIKDGKIILIDKYTGRVMDGRTFSDGLHQAIEAKEGLEITEENTTQATITVQNYFRMYKGLSGMTGSAIPSRREFQETYNLNVITIPPNKPIQRQDLEDMVFVDSVSKFRKIVEEVKKFYQLGRPVLIGTTSIEQSEKLSGILKGAKIPHQLLNAKTEEDEAKIISLAGQKAQVMIATNMAGRGTDILLGEGVKELGGLHIIGTEKHESKRIDMQLRGRSGRQGDPGSSQFIISLEDDLFHYYDETEKERFQAKIKANEENLILSPDPVKFVSSVQETIENMYYSSRSHLLKLDSVLDQQSKVVYSNRDRIITLPPAEIFDELLDYMENFINRSVGSYFSEEEEPRSPERLIHELSLVSIDLELSHDKIADFEEKELTVLILDKFQEVREFILSYKENEPLGIQLKHFILQHTDMYWIQHLDQLSHMRDGVQLKGYGQEDPYRLFEKEAFERFNELISKIESSVSFSFMEYLQSEQAAQIDSGEEDE
ncbi:accessory Sec system translocase SecA2 [Cytobacillus firmus]|uniref:accessory Sec system translocase SecA2 n=1 Tax=Cytobacillus firmus TaxID=1399 RepID=UPI002186B261|nr:accessory Sec system translocase SecA2 [Cytobacillus firmus]URM33418.1 accessory Sec system translocase SecA2 [Cytobacillus firmus]